MTPEQFFADFGHLADAPNGVQKLRGLILQLAVRGKLVEQDPADEPTTSLLERIQAEKARLVKEKKIRKADPMPPVSAEEAPYELPKGWKWVRLGDICTYIQRGKGPVYADSSTHRVISQKCVRWYGLDLEPARYIDPVSLEKYEPVRFLRVGDLLWNSTGTGTIGRACLVPQELEELEIVADSHVTVVRSIEVSPTFLWRWIQSPIVQDEIEGSASGTTNQIELNTSTVINHLMPLPPLAEQHRIVTKVDQLMALCDELETKQQRSRTKLTRLNNAALDRLTSARETDDFTTAWQLVRDSFDLLYTTPETIAKLRQAILQLAVQGKLVPQDPDDEPASVQLARIKAEQEQLMKEKKIRKADPLPQVSADEEPYALQPGWEWVRLGEIRRVIEYGTSQKAHEFPKGVPILRMNNILDGKVLLENLKYVEDTIDELPRLYLKKNDLLFNRTNSYELVGKTGLFRGDDDRYTFASYLIRIALFHEYLDASYINISMNSGYFRKTQIEPEITQQCGQANFNGTKLGMSSIPLPPHAEQHRIVAKVDQLMALCDELEAKLTRSQAKAEKLTAAAVQGLIAA